MDWKTWLKPLIEVHLPPSYKIPQMPGDMIRIALAKANRARFWKWRLPLPGLVYLIMGIAGVLPATLSQAATTNYFARGIIKEVKPGGHQLVIAHENIPNFMDAMTMPFNVKDAAILTN